MLIDAFKFELVEEVSSYSVSSLSLVLFAAIGTDLVAPLPLGGAGLAESFLALGALLWFVKYFLA